MNIYIRFLGASQEVTGSKFLLEVDEFKILIDCGLFQGKKELRLLNWSDFPIKPTEIDCILLTHAHIDHTGYLPRLVKQGYKNSIHCTHPTLDLVKILLLDSAKLQEEEASYARKKGYSKHTPPEPLYDEKDAQKVFPLLISHPFGQWIKINDNIEVRFQTAGHILGASIIEVLLKGEKENKKIVFSGDLGRYQDPLMPPPTPIQEADILLIESTYGNRDNIDVFPEKELGRIVRQTLKNGCLIIPAFSVGRTQSVLYYLTQLLEKQEIPNAPIFVDSPMAIDVTELYDKYDDCHSLAKEVFQQEPNFLKHPNIHYYQSQEQSISLNEIRKGAIIISASGMATGGRILHHLYNRLPNSQDTILFVGYQSEGTRGRDLLEGKEFIKIFGSYVPVKAHIEYIAGLSAHADQEELLQWISNFKQSPKITFITHGEKEASQSLASLIQEKFHWKNVVIPNYMEGFVLFRGI
ncbi:MBL fold metallo-hydrolase RNA specificity domain-containing protein [Raineya orbicola]|uniref:Putative exonuclease of the beta-lactamase fold n=1 Tax=Raineya orbicola TaxID=2016530 RepID=A0A2N3I6V5_9BACT|nr:MBL fold metallo-hydrolase [Raineya orbicola]PKQ66040.1 putative exonuclease of the beta-lactamase fold [Raineya orbicola]